MIIDTHAHYDDGQFDADREELLGSMEAGGIGLIVNAGSTVASWDKIVELTEKYPFVYGAVGVHPDEVGELDEEKFLRMADLLELDKIVAVGEIGLDYYWDKENMIYRKNGSSVSLTWRGKKSCLLSSTAERQRQIRLRS